MNIEVTKFFNECNPFDYCDSSTDSSLQLEVGEDKGSGAWINALKDYKEFQLLKTDSELQAMRDHVNGFGTWNESQISSWNEVELNALLIQLVAGDMRECNLSSDTTVEQWEAFPESAGNGSLYRGITGRIFYALD